jgi:signal transduction histidine kinase
VDSTAIYRVLLNLGTNAVDACPDDTGRVTVRSRRVDEEWFTLEVQDTGCGISPEHRERLFTEFFSTKGAKGTGLGLPVTAKIVREHGGRIEVESEVGEGTRFVVWLPIAGDEPRQKQRRKEEDHGG